MHDTARSLHRSAYLIVAGLAVAMSALGASLPSSAQLGLLVACVALLGVPHGALDPVMAYASGIAKTGTKLARFLVNYLSQAALVVALWWIAPVLTLSAFLMLSIWHFRGDWRNELPEWYGLVAAAAIVSMPALFHPSAVGEIFAELSFGASTGPLVPALSFTGLLSTVGLGFIVLRLAAVKPRVALELMTLPLLAWALPPLMFFTVYFCGLHSPRHIIESVQATRIRRRTIWLVGSVVTALTLGFGIGAYAWLPLANPMQSLIAIVFVGLAALTVPHMILIERTNRVIRAAPAE